MMNNNLQESLLSNISSSDTQFISLQNQQQCETSPNNKCCARKVPFKGAIVILGVLSMLMYCVRVAYIRQDIISPMAVYDTETDTFSAASYPHLEALLTEKSRKGSKHWLSPERKEAILGKMETEVDPCHDFYDHICGAWEDSMNPLSDSVYTPSFDDIMRRTVKQQFHTLDSNFEFVTPFFRTCMNPDDVETSGDAQLTPLMDLIDQVTDGDSFFNVLGQLHRGNLASDVIFQHELVPLSGDLYPDLPLKARTHSTLISPVITSIPQHYGRLPHMLRLLKLASDHDVIFKNAAVAQVADKIVLLMHGEEKEEEGSMDGEEASSLMTCSPASLMKLDTTSPLYRMFINYGRGLANGQLYRQQDSKAFIEARNCLFTGREATAVGLAKFFYNLMSEEMAAVRAFLKVSVVVNSLNLLPSKYSEAWGKYDPPSPLSTVPSTPTSSRSSSRSSANESRGATAPRPHSASTGSGSGSGSGSGGPCPGDDIDKGLHYAPFDGPEGYPDVCLTEGEVWQVVAADMQGLQFSEIMDQEALPHINADIRGLSSSTGDRHSQAIFTSSSTSSSSTSSSSPFLLVKWMSLTHAEMAREWVALSLPADAGLRSAVWRKMDNVQRAVCKQAELRHQAKERREQLSPLPIVDDFMLKKRFHELYDAKALQNSEEGVRELQCKEFTLKTFNNLFAHDWVLGSFPKENLEVAQELVDIIYQQMAKHIKQADWLGDTTLRWALRKWSKMARNVAFDSDWQEAPDISLSGHMFMDAAVVFAEQKARGYALLDQPVDRYKFPFAPGQMDLGFDYFTANAFYLPASNSINMLAGLMTEPLFSADMPMQLNLASYGYIIGHEITHAFDARGRLFDGEGRQTNWWTEQAEAEFDTRAQCLVDQVSSFRYYGLFHVNGERTLNENIADLGGLSVAWDAFNEYEQRFNPQGDRLMPEYSNRELFWIYAGQTWCSKASLLGELWELAKNKHSPGKVRVNAPMSNLQGFAETFQCSRQSVMGRSRTQEACKLW